MDNTPRAVAEVRCGERWPAGRDDAGHEADLRRGQWRHATRRRPSRSWRIRYYMALSSSFAGTQEYMAMEKLGRLHKQAERTGDWDLIVVDTPPSRSALDFLDAPERLASLLEGGSCGCCWRRRAGRSG